MTLPPEDATRRTWLASERTLLAWVRTGLAAVAVAVGVGRVVPEIADAGARWPYTAVGAGYALLGAALAHYGFRRRREVDDAVREGGYAPPRETALTGFAVAAVGLALATAVLVVAGP